jgi:hypothetical protein
MDMALAPWWGFVDAIKMDASKNLANLLPF